jgi:hypothetical protein
MIRTLLAALALAVVFVPANADEPKKEKLTVDLFASVEDQTLAKKAPENGVIASQKAWEALAKDWGIKDAPKVDFTKEILVVATTVGSRLNLNTKLSDKGDLTVLALATRDLRPGFRYAIKSVSRDGIKTVNGKELPK